MKTKILSTIAVFAMIWGLGAVRYSPAQTRSEMPAEHASPGHQMNAPSDGGFHHRFEDAEKWAKEFDNPEREGYKAGRDRRPSLTFLQKMNENPKPMAQITANISAPITIDRITKDFPACSARCAI